MERHIRNDYYTLSKPALSLSQKVFLRSPSTVVTLTLITLTFSTGTVFAQELRRTRIEDHFQSGIIWRSDNPVTDGLRAFEDSEERSNYYSIDGWNNNLTNPNFGIAGIRLWRHVASQYTDGISEPARPDQPSARAISNIIFDQPESIPNSKGLSDMVWQWGQFVDHDLDLTETSLTLESFPIEVPAGDPWFDPSFTGTQTIPLMRSAYVSYTGIVSPREQVNFITAWLDGSQVYGSDEETANSLRTFENGMLRKSSGNLLPLDEDGFFEAGDIRVNEQVYLTAMHTLFMREHNRICRQLMRDRRRLSDEEIYQEARARVIETLQRITYEEFLPAILGDFAMPDYPGYDDRFYPNITNTFSTSAYRFGHSMLNSQLLRLDDDGNEISAGHIHLAEAFFSPTEIIDHGIEPYLKGLCHQKAQEVDAKVVDDVRNFLFGPPGSGGFDLASLNIQRGRDHGLADINSIRARFFLPAHRNFADVTSDKQTQADLEGLYGDVENADPWVIMLCEDHFPGAIVGETAMHVIRDQFIRLRRGDRLFYLNRQSSDTRFKRESSRLSDVIKRNTNLRNVPRDVFRVTN